MMDDAQIAAIMGWPEEHLNRDHADAPLSLLARVLALVAAAEAGERAQAEADAARYRWLTHDDERIGERLRGTLDTWDGCDGKAGFDSAIDAAMREG